MSILEKHFTLDTNLSGPDHKASSNPKELKELISTLRKIEKGLGNGKKKVITREMTIKQIARKSLVFTRSLKLGNIISTEDLTAKRPGLGISPMEYPKFVGKVLKRSVKKLLLEK